ncbi:sigma 54 modulation/S30EA ribosomal C-terminal domain-containing protein [Pseudonocardia xishanensis]|uniref:HPF/RaiA family ribosome-associated protein n=1 Tax=Pseudonocardia xishanensis TaxID=630995 RepID=A0ABP8RYG6_9PSEU
MTTPDTDVVVQLVGDHPPGTHEKATETVRAALRHARGPVLHATVRIGRHPDPAARPPVLAEATVDVDGHPVRARAHAATEAEALDLLQYRLRVRLVRDRHHRAAHWEDRRGEQPSGETHEWRHGQDAGPRPPFFPRPPEERRIIRHKTFSVGPVDLDEAAFDLEVLDHDFHLFTEAGTGQEGVLYPSPEGLRLALVDPRPEDLAPHAVGVTVSPQPAPVLTTDEACERLGILGVPFLFHLDADRGRGALVYRRYDGHYGLITPAD